MALCTQIDLEKALQIDFGDPSDPVAAFLIENSQALVETYLDRKVESQSHVETFDGHLLKSAVLYTKEWPISSVTSVVEDGVTLTADVDYRWWEGGRLVRFAADGDTPALWTVGWKNIVVTYDGGYSTVPHDIRAVCVNVAARAFEKGAAFAGEKDPGVAKESIGDYRVTYETMFTDDHDLLLTTPERRRLDRYKRFL